MTDAKSVAGVDLDRVWLGVAAEVWRRRPGRIERLAIWALRSPGLARALLTTPSLLVPWLIASVVVLAAGVAATVGSGVSVVPLVAPAVAAAGIAYAYGPGVDPAYELSRSMAVSDRMVLLVRAVAVFGIDAVIGVVASAASATAVGLTFGWLIPMSAMSALALATATVARSANAGVAAGLAGWAITIVSTRAATGAFSAAVTSSLLTLPYAAIGVCCAVIVVASTRVSRGSA
jgi:hypothetical protein